MCGIFGRLDLVPGLTDSTELDCLATDALTHRGPDDRGTWWDEGIFLGMRRLSVIDLPGGHQPMCNETGTIWLVYNGEVYNYRELRSELVGLGHSFRTNSDTEVIVHAYEQWGPGALARFNGMFAMALWDRRQRVLFLARDRLGIKPLYYLRGEKRFLFASEIKAILADPEVPRGIDLKGLNNYLTYGHAVAPNTMLQGVEKLLPGYYMQVSERGITAHRWWDAISQSEPDSGSTPNEADYADEIRRLLEDSVRLRLVSDVPLGAFLSGGVDSSAIVGVMSKLMDRPVQTFSVGFAIGGRYNELADARRVADHFRSDHHEMVVDHLDLVDVLQKLVYHYDEPFGDAASFPTYLVSRFARQQVTVVLTGDGGDELFGGYRRYWAEQCTPVFRMLPLLFRERVIRQVVGSMPRLRRLKKMVEAMSVPEPDVRYATWLTVMNDELKRELLDHQLSDLLLKLDSSEVYRQHFGASGHLDRVNRLMYSDIKSWLPDTYLEKVDKASMAVSLEARLPLLDYRLVELAMRIPSRYKIRGVSTKRIFKRAVADLLPVETLRKRKHGFAVPTDPWLRGPLQDFAYDVLMDERTERRGIFVRRGIERLWREHRSGREVRSDQLWLLLNFELWARAYLDREVA